MLSSASNTMISSLGWEYHGFLPQKPCQFVDDEIPASTTVDDLASAAKANWNTQVLSKLKTDTDDADALQLLYSCYSTLLCVACISCRPTGQGRIRNGDPMSHTTMTMSHSVIYSDVPHH